MGRHKNAAEKSALSGKSIIEKWQAATFGREYSARAASFLTCVRNAVLLDEGYEALEQKGIRWPGVINAQQHDAITANERNKSWMKLVKFVREASESGDGSMFRAIAHHLECEKHPLSPVEHWVGMVMQMCYEKKVNAPPIADVVRALNLGGQNTSYVQVKRYYDKYGVAASPGPIGRPAKAVKKANNSRARS